jgi:hypothetical protein
MVIFQENLTGQWNSHKYFAGKSDSEKISAFDLISPDSFQSFRLPDVKTITGRKDWN